MTFSEWWDGPRPQVRWDNTETIALAAWNAATEEAAKICDGFGEKFTAEDIRANKEADRGAE